MNWGYRILLLLCGFIGMMSYFIFVAMRQDNEMMDSSYYEKEKLFEHTLNAAANLKNEAANVEMEQINGDVYFSIPLKDDTTSPKVEMEFICYADQRRDRKFSKFPDSNGKIMIPAKEFNRGQYQLRMEWKSMDKNFAIRERFYYKGL